MAPIPVADLEQMRSEGYEEKWICYLSEAYSAKELTVLPGQTVTIKDQGAYGLIVLQGHGKLGVWDIETPSLIRFGQLTHDEYFVSADAAKAGQCHLDESESDGPDRHAQAFWTGCSPGPVDLAVRPGLRPAVSTGPVTQPREERHQ